MAWLIEVRDLMLFQPSELMARVYLSPHTDGPRLRRGVSLTFLRRPAGSRESASLWDASGEPRTWAQVARSGRVLRDHWRVPRRSEWPFIVEGPVPDQDLIAVIDFIRTSPERKTEVTENPDGTETWQTYHPVEGNRRVLSVAATGDSTYEVTTERRPGAGQEVVVKVREGRCEVVEVAEWVA